MMVSRRRMLIAGTGLLTPWGLLNAQIPSEGESSGTSAIPSTFPSQDPERVRAVVGASHGRIEEVRSLLKESPALATATIDWGFGDWETALGAASHVGNREIAALLIDHGARPDIFTFAMLGQLEVVKSYIEASPGIQKIRGPHGFTLMHHAKQGGARSEAVVAYLTQVGEADIRQISRPLEPDDMRRYVGSYDSADDPPVRLDFAITRNGILSVKREPYGSARNLLYRGDRSFAPVGADAVRISFDESLTECTVVDPPLQIAFKRSG